MSNEAQTEILSDSNETHSNSNGLYTGAIDTNSVDIDEALGDMELDDAIQVASFHPQYRFADTQPEDIENYTNRSPYPMLQLLRESSMVRAVEAYPQAEQIFEKNIETLRRMGHTGWEALGLQPLRGKK